jgi:pimeloyl-ACP methyl ester carboxylesterase
MFVLHTTSADGTDVRAHDDGHGPPIVALHPGMDDGRRLGHIASLLAPRWRVVRIHRRQYRVDLKADPRLGAPANTIAQEVDDVLAVVRSVGPPVLLYGHSDGGVVALEALVAEPESFAGAVIYEPAAVIGPPLGGSDGEIIRQARAALTARRPDRAMAVFLQDVVRFTPLAARLAGALTAAVPRYRRLIPCQINSVEALDRLGNRLDAYADINVPTVMLGGERRFQLTTTTPFRNPAHIGERLMAVARAIPSAEQVVMPGQAHGADLAAPQQVARIVADLAERVLR